MKRKTLIITISLVSIFSVALVCAWPSIYLHLIDGRIVLNGIEEYDPVVSDRSLCKFMTLRDEVDGRTPGTALFVDQYRWSDAFFRYEEICYGGLYHETALLVLSYDAENYRKAFEDVSSQPGFSDEISFSYGGFDFRLNDTERIVEKERGYHSMTNFNVHGPDPYIFWINLVGWSEFNKTIAFVGFFHAVERRSGFWSFESTYYSFKGWDKLLREEFSFYEWNS